MPKTTEIDKKIRQKIGEKIEMHRKLRRKNRAWLAEKIGVSYQQIENYEKGKQRVSASRLFEIAALLKFDILEFFPKEEDKEQINN